MDILIATHNIGKFKEIENILMPSGARFHSLSDLGIEEDFDESKGESYEENAIGKARFYAERAKDMIVVADDSGVNVQALDGELGVKTRRWGAGEDACDELWLDTFMKRMEKEKMRNAAFLCCAVIRMPNGEEKVFIGETKGEIVNDVMAPIQSGIPLSSVFLPEGFNKVYSAMSEEEKNKISHRGKAFSQILDFLQNFTPSHHAKSSSISN